MTNTTPIKNQINILFQMIVADYKRINTNTTAIKEFANGLGVSYGRKYIKITSNGSVWGFIVNTNNDKKFQYGDILLPVSWSAPARNSARGNVFDLNADSSVYWTGPGYLK